MKFVKQFQSRQTNDCALRQKPTLHPQRQVTDWAASPLRWSHLRQQPRFAPNELDVKSISLVLTDPHPHYDVEEYGRNTTKPGQRFSGPIGLDGLYRKGEPSPDGVNAVKGNWQDERTFVIDRLLLGQGLPPERWTLKFDGEKLTVSAENENGSEISVDGKTGG
jgi:hypothetical protein